MLRILDNYAWVTMLYSTFSPTCSTLLSFQHSLGNYAMHDPPLYRSTIGGLQYLAHTRPDLTYSVNRLSQFLQAPSDSHWKIFKRVFSYLKGTLNHGLTIQKNDSFLITAFSDSDWASYPDDNLVSYYCWVLCVYWR